MIKTAKDLNPKEWKALCTEWPQSGLPQKAFCAERGVDYKAFVNWRGRNKAAVARIAARKVKSTSAKSPLALIPVQIFDDETSQSLNQERHRTNHPISSAITITTRSGHQLHVEDGFNEQTLLRVLRTLKEAWLFADSVDGMEANAVLYSLVQTCIANQVDPYRYFKAVIERMPYARSQTDLEALLPWVLKQEFEDEAATVKLAA